MRSLRRKGIPNRTQMAGKLVRMVHILLIKLLRRNAIFVMKLMIILQQLVQEEQKLFSISPARSLLKWHQRKGLKSSEEKDIVFNVYPLEHHRAQANSDGKCQREFICKNVSHDKYPTKKHVLVCHEHRGTTENEQLLLEYKNRCIMKQTKLAAFSRDLKLTFRMNQQQPSDYKHPQSNQESAIYILQTIKVNKQDYSLFYDTGCCDMVSRYAAIKSIGSRAKQESSIPVSICGVGNTQFKSNHGIFQVKLLLFNGSEATFSVVCLDQITVMFPQYPLKGIVEEDVAAGHKRQGIT